MTDLLHGCRQKLARAEQHFDVLDAEVRAFLSSKLHRSVPKHDTKAAHSLYRVQVTKQPPPHWPVLLGDCLHNFRCTLDHLAWAIASKHGKAHDGTQFPLVDVSAKFASAYGGKINISKPKSIRAAFDRAQPYKRRSKLTSLWTLTRLNNIDKHRDILTTNMPLQPMFRISGSLMGMYEAVPGPYDDPTDILHFRVPFGPNGPVEVNIELLFEIQISNVEIVSGRPVNLPLIETLRDIRDSVRLTVSMMEIFCD